MNVSEQAELLTEIANLIDKFEALDIMEATRILPRHARERVRAFLFGHETVAVIHRKLHETTETTVDQLFGGLAQVLSTLARNYSIQ